MNKHEEIKKQCAQILNYYGVIADEEYNLPNNQRIDVVGYFKNKKEPDIGIEVELTSDLAKDTSKLLGIQTLQLRIIVSDKSDALSLRNGTYNGKTVEIVRPPSEDIAFEEKIRNYSESIKRPRFNAREWKETDFKQYGDLIKEFETDIKDQGLNVEVAKDVLLRSGLGGINVGYYKQGKYNTQFYQSEEIPKELLYLKALSLIFEGRPGHNYEEGRALIYYLSEHGKELFLDIVRERVHQNKEKLLDIAKRYGLTSLIISLIGCAGSFNDISENHDLSRVLNEDPYTGVYIPVKIVPQDVPRYIIEKFNIHPQAIYASRISASSPTFHAIAKNVYDAMVQNGLGNMTRGISTRGNYLGMHYSVPIHTILEELDVKRWPDSMAMENLKDYAAWVIIRAHNPSVPINNISTPSPPHNCVLACPQRSDSVP